MKLGVDMAGHEFTDVFGLDEVGGRPPRPAGRSAACRRVPPAVAAA